MATDVLVSRELKSLQDELSAAKTQRAANSERSAATSAPIAPPTAAEPAARAVGGSGIAGPDAPIRPRAHRVIW